MVNNSIALGGIPSTHPPIADRIGSSAAGKATETILSHPQPAYASSLGLKQVRGAALEGGNNDQSVVTVLIEPNALLREGLRSILVETRYNPVALASSLEDIGSLPVPEDGVGIFIMDAVKDYDNA